MHILFIFFFFTTRWTVDRQTLQVALSFINLHFIEVNIHREKHKNHKCEAPKNFKINKSKYPKLLNNVTRTLVISS